ncbi:calcium/sodium antiporter [Kiritimatiellaeota bacterium B1221]|nr:calcium/sodium antiporter [Kiritimatiellaeota bacterium B1221]
MSEILSWGPAWLFPVLALFGGLWLLIKSSDVFVEGASGVARHLGISPIVIGMVIVGFGTSAPEMVVSAFSALEGKPALALGNAFGSNIANISLILGVTSLVIPIQVHSNILRREFPLLTGVTLISLGLIADGELSRMDGVILIGVFVASMSWTVWLSFRRPQDELLQTLSEEMPPAGSSPMRKSLGQLVLGMVVLLISSRALVWGAVALATMAGVSELIIGLTVVAIGTSLPELASTLTAVRKGEHDMAIGNVVGSNLFNTLAVVGIAGSIHPFGLDAEILQRDFPFMLILTVSLFVFGWGRKGRGRINRIEGGIYLLSFLIYTGLLIRSVLGS